MNVIQNLQRIPFDTSSSLRAALGQDRGSTKRNILVVSSHPVDFAERHASDGTGRICALPSSLGRSCNSVFSWSSNTTYTADRFVHGAFLF